MSKSCAISKLALAASDGQADRARGPLFSVPVTVIVPHAEDGAKAGGAVGCGGPAMEGRKMLEICACTLACTPGCLEKP